MLSLTIETAALLETLNRAAKFADKAATGTIKNCILLTVGESDLTAEAGDAKIEFTSAPIPALVRESGALAVAAPALLAAVKAIGDGPCTMREQSGSRLTLTAPGVSYTLAGMDGADYPHTPAPEGPALTFATPDLCRMFAAVMSHIAPEDNRYGLNGTQIELRDQVARFVATDGNRLAWAECPVFGVQIAGVGTVTLPRKALLPRAAVVALSALFDGVDSPVVVTSASTSVHFVASVGTVRCRWQEADFPDYRQVVPSDVKGATWTVKRADLLRAIDRALPFAAGNDKTITLSFADDGVTLATRQMDIGESSIVCSGVVDGEQGTVGLNGRFLRDTVGSMEAETLAFGFGKALSPILIVPDGSGWGVGVPRLCVVMPVRL